MPYIAQEQRDQLDDEIDELIQALENLKATSKDGYQVNGEGCINYAFTRIIQHFYGADQHTTSYGKIVLAAGILANVSDEFYRKVAAPYEDIKELENGPVKKTSK